MPQRLRMMIVVTHLLGVGHLARATALGRAMAARGHQVTLLSGGQPAPLLAAACQAGGVALVQLPPVHVRGTAFSDLRQDDGAPLSPAMAQARRTQAIDALCAMQPDVLITELYPFGRRALADEFGAILAAARRLPERPLILASVRDILARPSKPAKIDATHDILRQCYDGVLAHGDPLAAPLEASWPLAEDLHGMLHYTGYVDEVAATPLAPATDRAGVLVSGGGSAASLPLLEAALAAAALDPDRPWRLLVGHSVPEARFTALARQAPANVTIERARPDFRALLGACAVSVSQFGYNTALDLLATGAPAVVVPFAAGGETEQSERAALFAARGLVEALPEPQLTPAALLAAVNRAATRSYGALTPGSAIAVDGARRTAEIVEQLAAARRADSADLAVPAPARHNAWRASLDAAAEALDRAADQGQPIAFWWRDDDVVAPTPQLERLLAMAQAHGAPLALAAIPAAATVELARRLDDEPQVTLLPHGLSHANLAPAGAKSGELSHGAPEAIAARAAEGLALLRRLAPTRLQAVLTPPWNRIHPEALALLPAHGFVGVSTFRERAAVEAAPGLIQLNTHIDPVNWRGDRSLVSPAALAGQLVEAIARRNSDAAQAQLGPIGLLSHHLVHDAAIDGWLEALIDLIASHPGVRLVDVSAALAAR